MQRATFLRYLEDYNSGDVDRVLPHYEADVVFENYGRSQQGADVGTFLRWLHTAVSNRLIPRHLLIDGDEIALEAEAEVIAHMDLPDLPIGAMRKGERATSRMFAFYHTRGERIAHVRIAGWPLIKLP